MEVNPGATRPARRPPGARLFPAFAWSGRRSRSRSRGTTRCRRACACGRPHGVNAAASYTLGHASDHVSGLNIGGEQRPVLPVTIGDDASIERALWLREGRRAVRRPPPLRRQLQRRSCRRPTDRGGHRASRRRLAGERHRPGADRVSALTVIDPSLDIRYLTNRPNQTCDPNDDAPHTVEQWFTTSCFTRRALWRDRRARRHAAQQRARPGFRAHRPVAVQEHRPCRPHRLQLRVEAFNLFNQTRFGQPGNQIGTANFGRITTPKMDG